MYIHIIGDTKILCVDDSPLHESAGKMSQNFLPTPDRQSLSFPSMDILVNSQYWPQSSSPTAKFFERSTCTAMMRESHVTHS